MTVQTYLVVAFSVIIIASIVSAIITYKVKMDEYKRVIKLDISIEKMCETEARIEQFFKDNNLEKGTEILEVAKVLKVEKGSTEEGLKEQALLKENGANGNKVVVFKADLSEKERSFAFAHEVAHLINGDGIPATRPSGRYKSEIEQLADYTAAALLMPLDAVYNSLEKKNYSKISAKKKTKIIHELCKEYSVSEVIAVRRIKEVYALKSK